MAFTDQDKSILNRFLYQNMGVMPTQQISDVFINLLDGDQQVRAFIISQVKAYVDGQVLSLQSIKDGIPTEMNNRETALTSEIEASQDLSSKLNDMLI